MPSANTPAISFLGFGEAGQAFSAGFDPKDFSNITAFDVKTDAGSDVAKSKFADYEAANVSGHATLKDALAGAGIIFSMVTADQAHAAACQAASVLDGSPLFFDCNSCSPQAKIKSAAMIEAAGGRYVDVAVMQPVHPTLHKTPIILSGPNAADALAAMASLGMAAEDACGDVGRASAIKLCRSIIVKGIEALTAEMLLSSKILGVQDVVLQSLEETYPGFNWGKRAPHSLERMAVHGIRRAAEMAETAVMVEALDMPADMSHAMTAWQSKVGQLGLPTSAENAEVQSDRLLDALGLSIAKP